MSYKNHVYGGRESSGSIVPTKRSNAGLGGPKEIVEGRPPAKENIAQSTPAPDAVPDEWANTWLGMRHEVYATERLSKVGTVCVSSASTGSVRGASGNRRPYRDPTRYVLPQTASPLASRSH